MEFDLIIYFEVHYAVEKTNQNTIFSEKNYQVIFDMDVIRVGFFDCLYLVLRKVLKVSLFYLNYFLFHNRST